MNRVDVVPWSTAPTYSLFAMSGLKHDSVPGVTQARSAFSTLESDDMRLYPHTIALTQSCPCVASKRHTVEDRENPERQRGSSPTKECRLQLNSVAVDLFTTDFAQLTTPFYPWRSTFGRITLKRKKSREHLHTQKRTTAARTTNCVVVGPHSG